MFYCYPEITEVFQYFETGIRVMNDACRVNTNLLIFNYIFLTNLSSLSLRLSETVHPTCSILLRKLEGETVASRQSLSDTICYLVQRLARRSAVS